jgi:hypothetical protein
MWAIFASPTSVWFVRAAFWVLSHRERSKFILGLQQRVHSERAGSKQGENAVMPPYWGGCEGAGELDWTYNLNSLA